MATINLVNSASDERTVNNVVRHEYRVLTPEEKANMKLIKDAGLDFLTLLDELDQDHHVQLARDYLEIAVCMAVKSITK